MDDRISNLSDEDFDLLDMQNRHAEAVLAHGLLPPEIKRKHARYIQIAEKLEAGTASAEESREHIDLAMQLLPYLYFKLSNVMKTAH